MGKFGKTARLISMLGLTGGFFLVEISVGYATNSMALVADSFHMLSDLIALIIGLLSVRIAKKQTERNTFGWVRAEVLGALINAVFLCALCFSIFVDSIERFTGHVEINNPKLVLIVGVVGLIINLVGLFLFHEHGTHGGHDHGHSHTHGHHTHHAATSGSEVPSVRANVSFPSLEHPAEPSPLAITVTEPTTKKKTLSSSQMNIHGVFLHVAGDALGSVVVIVAAAIIWKTDWKYRHYIDPAMSLISVVVILTMTLPLLYSSSLILLQSVPAHMNASAIRQGLSKVDGVLSIKNFHIWQLDGRITICSAHLQFHSYSKYTQVARQIKDYLQNEGIDRVTIETEFEDETPHAEDALASSADTRISKSSDLREYIPLRVQSPPALDGHVEGRTQERLVT